MERVIEGVVLSLRWLLLPLYLGLLLALVAIYAMIGKELWQLAVGFGQFTDLRLVLLLCSLLDLVLLANLMVMVAISSYESFISRIAATAASPEWLGKLDSGNVKVKVAVSVTMIAMIHLLRTFLEDEPGRMLLMLAAVQVVFVATALGIALIDRAQRPAPAH